LQARQSGRLVVGFRVTNVEDSGLTSGMTPVLRKERHRQKTQDYSQAIDLTHNATPIVESSGTGVDTFTRSDVCNGTACASEFSLLVNQRRQHHYGQDQQV
jgi:hypothetical protein